MTPILRRAENDTEQEIEHDGRGDLTLGQALVGRFHQFRRVQQDRLLPRLPGVRDLLGHGQELLLRDVNVFDVDESVLGLGWVSQDTDDSLSDRVQRGGAEDAVAAVEQFGLALLPVQEEVLFQAPVQKGIVAHEGVGEFAVGFGGRGLAERLVRRDFQLEDGQGGGFGVVQVAAVVGREEAFHVGGDGGGDEELLSCDAC